MPVSFSSSVYKWIKKRATSFKVTPKCRVYKVQVLLPNRIDGREVGNHTIFPRSATRCTKAVIQVGERSIVAIGSEERNLSDVLAIFLKGLNQFHLAILPIVSHSVLNSLAEESQAIVSVVLGANSSLVTYFLFGVVVKHIGAIIDDDSVGIVGLLGFLNGHRQRTQSRIGRNLLLHCEQSHQVRHIC